MAKSMSEASRKSQPKMSDDSLSSTSSPASEDGATRSDSPDGLTTDLFGQAVVPAKATQPPGSKKARPTHGTFGRRGFGSYASAALSESLANKLKTQLDTAGSTLFRQTWKRKITPSGRRYWAHTASGHRTSDNGCGSWPSPQVQDEARGRLKNIENEMARDGRGLNGSLALTAKMASWPSPCQQDGPHGGPSQGTDRLPGAASLATWVTPSSRDWKDTPGMATEGQDGRSRLDQLPRQAHLVSGLTPTGSPAETASGGQLNPALSRWLMGLPPAWCDCAVTAMPSSRKSRRRSSRPTWRSDK